MLLDGMHDYCSDRSSDEPVQHTAGRVNAIAGANRRQKQQVTAEVGVVESSTSTSDESSDDGEIDPEPAKIAVVESAALVDVYDTINTSTATVGSSAVTCWQDLPENTAAENTQHVTQRQKAVNIVVNRTAEIQVFRVIKEFPTYCSSNVILE